nr:unnamed protein product [Callosobruchus analis]
MRPIVSSINCPNSNLSAFLTKILTSAYNTENDFYVKDSFAFSIFINDYKLPDDYVIVSFDVVSLFTNLPLDVIVTSLHKHWTEISQHTSLDFESFLKILKFIFDSNYFVFNDCFYKQIFGTPMGSKISPILVNFVLDDLVRDCLSSIPFNIPFVKRYVDDLLLALPKDQIQHVLTTFNGFNPNLQFTVEEERNNSIPFLDMVVMRDPSTNALCTKWYRKSMSSGRYINFHSYHHPRMKRNLVLALKNRVLGVSHPRYRKESLDTLKALLVENSYPTKYLNFLLYNLYHPLNIVLSNQNSHIPPIQGPQVGHDNPISNTSPPSEAPFLIYKTLPFIEDLTPRLLNIFKDFPVRIALCNVLPVSIVFSKLKTPVKPLEKSDIVYSISCCNCNKAYIGQTSRNLKSRITSHKSDINREVNSCGLAQHAIETRHKINWESAKVLDIERNFEKRIFLEMVHINNCANNLNKKSDINNLSSIYSYILRLDHEGFGNVSHLSI